MGKNKLQGRDSALDIIRIVAVFTVISVHFFLNNGFYSQTVDGTAMYVMVIMRTLFSVCVPLFMVLTGYLMSHKTLSRKYYKGIVHTLIIFVLATLACMIFKTVKYGDPFSLSDFIFSTLDFTGANYSWYIEMYIGLFLIAPFLNLAYNGLKSQKQKQVIVITFIAITILPSLFNIYNFDVANWWIDPKTSDTFAKLVPNWWMGFYPVTYYFTGCYLREFGIKLKTRTMILLFVAFLFIFGTFNYYRSYGTTFKSGIYVYWYGFEPYVLTILLFATLKRINTENFKNGAKFVLYKLSGLALGIYLISYIFDSIVYPILNKAVYNMPDRLPYYFVTVPIVFICSAVSSAVLNVIAKYIVVLFNKIKDFIIKQLRNPKKRNLQDYVFIILIGGGLIFAFWKSIYGFGGNVEAFYLTVPQRFIMGDSPIKDEWHLSQLSGFLLMPFVWLFTTITGSTEGIILTGRAVYIIFHAVVSILIYVRLRKHGYLSIVASVLYFIFTPFNIMALSYNTMGLDFLALAGVIMGSVSYKKKLPLVIGGLLFAASVLCCPYLAFVYVIYGICTIINWIIRKKETDILIKSDLFAPKTFLFFSLGVIALAVVFLIFVLTRVSVSEIFEYIPYLLGDPEHPQTSLIHKISVYFTAIFESVNYFKFILAGYILMLVIMLLDKKRMVHRSVYLIVSAVITALSLILFSQYLTTTTFNSIMLPMIFVGLTSYILCKNKNKNLFATLFLTGILYSVAISFSSNQQIYVISMAVSASNIASYIFLGQLIKEIKTSDESFEYAKHIKQTSFVFAALLILLQGGLEIASKATHVFWESPKISNLSYQISNGPAKGIYTNINNYNTYETIYKDIQYYNYKPKDKILFLTSRTWCYLAAEFPYGTLSAWITGEKPQSIERLKQYYSVNPENKPKYIYIPKNSEWNFTDIYTQAEENGYTLEENDISYKLEKIN